MSATTFDDCIRGQWFAPICDRIQEFENDIGHGEALAAVVEPNSPEWAVNGLMKLMKPHGELVGMPLKGS